MISNMSLLEVKAMKTLVWCLALFAVVGLAPCYVFGWIWLYVVVLTISTVVVGAGILVFLWAIILLILETREAERSGEPEEYKWSPFWKK